MSFREKQRERFRRPGAPHPEQELLKARLTLQICRIIKERHLTQAQAGEILGIKQAHANTVTGLASSRHNTRSLRSSNSGAILTCW
jgi:predicted XRE-type DNA-binding protein